ncbi:MAG: MotA/TolQ/ExbB proton channel family protein [Candidatus Alcyoniella australis]|nr:MotA/TolQ/ExbB proton channel family protein [Candidatus Alcyoniella australis]
MEQESTLFAPFQAGGPAMYVIAIFSIFAIAIIIERTIYIFFRYNINGPAFMNQVTKLINANNIDRALQLCKAAKNAALARVIEAGLKRHDRSEREIQDAVDEAALEILPQLQKRTGYLQMIANVSTLLGLLGTIMGIILAFQGVADADAKEKQEVLATGIYRALYTTAAGLIVAIPALVAHSVLMTKTVRIIDEIDEFSVKLINMLVARQSKQSDGK